MIGAPVIEQFCPAPPRGRRRTGTGAMIITDPAAMIIRDTFGRHLAPLMRLDPSTRRRGSARPFTSQAYAEAGLATANNQPARSPATKPSAMQRRETPLR